MRRLNPASNCIIGGEFPIGEKYASPETINFVWNLGCEKAEIFLTDLIKDNLFPVFEGERFCTEALWVYAISRKTKRKFLLSNEGIRYTEYLDDGLTKNRRKIKRENPIGYIEYYKILLKTPELYRHPKSVIIAFLDLVRLHIISRGR